MVEEGGNGLKMTTEVGASEGADGAHGMYTRSDALVGKALAEVGLCTVVMDRRCTDAMGCSVYGVTFN